MRGSRNLDQGEQAVDDPNLLKALRRRAWYLYIMSAAGGAALTGSCWLLRFAGY